MRRVAPLPAHGSRLSSFRLKPPWLESVSSKRWIVIVQGGLGLVSCFTHIEKSESNGIAEGFVKTFKRDYVRVNPIPDADTALAAVGKWMADCNEERPHGSLGT